MPGTREDIDRYVDNLQGEVEASALYNAMAKAETNPQLAEVYRKLATIEDKHAALWKQKLREAGVNPDTIKPGLRAKLNGWLVRRFGPSVILPTMANLETADRTRYDHQPEATKDFPMDERSHARVLTLLARAPGGAEGGVLAKLEGRHKSIGGNALRAAVLGGADGLVSNLSLVMGVAGAQMSEHAILVTGLAGLLAGASSMAIGEWVSVQSSRELNQRQLAVEADELMAAPAEEEEELSLIYQAKGLPEVEAKALAKKLISDPTKALDTLAREELGIDPDELGGSAWEAAYTSFLLFSCGAIIPVFPFFFLKGYLAVGISILASALGLFGIGALITLVTGRSVLRSGLRQLAMGLAAALVTYTIGHLIGVNLAG
jgi:vacuolar iron transporter family protein